MRHSENAPLGIIGLFFLLSGMAALIYQISWQRVLFAAFGSDISSTTLIIASFMLGLGLGAWFGGIWSDRFPQASLLGFALAETGIGIYGISSHSLLLWISDKILHQPDFIAAMILFLTLLPPTLLMGATLPILITHLSRIWRHVGRATGWLYAINTLGASLGALATGFILFDHFTIDQTLVIAATINLVCASGLVGLLFLFRVVRFS